MFTRAFRPAAFVACALSLVACSTVNSVATQIQAACGEAMPLVPLAGPVAPYIVAGCSADGIVKLASDPSSVQWLGQIIGQVKALYARPLVAVNAGNIIR